MSGSQHFSVTAASALVLGGIAAIVLAAIVATSGYGRPSGHAAGAPAPSNSAHDSPSSAPSAAGVLREGEYLLDVSDLATGDSGPAR